MIKKQILTDKPSTAQKAGSHPQSKLSSEDWQGIMLNMREAFKGDPAVLAKYKADTVDGLKLMWRLLFEVHRRRWANEIENSGKFYCTNLFLIL